MCIANHPVLYDLHVTELAQACDRQRAAQVALVAEAAPGKRRDPVTAQPGFTFRDGLVALLGRALRAKPQVA